MKIKTIISFFSIILLISACNPKLPCTGKQYSTDSKFFVGFGSAQSKNEQMAADKALFNAKYILGEEVNQYIDDTYNHPTLAPDPAYFTKLEKAKKTALKNIEIRCEQTLLKKEIYQSYISIQLNKDSLNTHVKETLKQTIN